MHLTLRFSTRAALAAALLGAMAFHAPSLQATDAPAQSAKSHAAPPEVKISELAHKVLADGLKLNALAGDGLQPWHIKIDYQLRTVLSSKPIHGSVEQWSADTYRWKRTYISKEDSFNGSIWSTSRTSRFQTKAIYGDYGPRTLIQRVSRPVLNPLYQAANIKPDYQMTIQKVTTAGLNLLCVSVVDPARYAPKTDPDWLFPTYCFDTNLHLHLVVAGDTTVQFQNLQPFQNRMVARTVQVIQNGALVAQMNVSVLENWPATDPGILTPPKKAELQHYTLEPGQPKPQPVYQVAASLPILDDAHVFRGLAIVPAVIQKDGNVKVRGIAGFIPPLHSPDSQSLSDAICDAVKKWRYKPYLVDGQPVEVAYNIPYSIDGKPFVPVYEMPTTPPGDFSSTYDFHRDPAADLALAETEAQAQHKRILLEVGGDWCYWCHQLDDFFKGDAAVRKLRDDNFILVKVNMSAENPNGAFLSHYPTIPGYPWIFVLGADGKFLKSEDTDLLQSGDLYSSRNVTEFLTAWKQP
ncbi:MAG TPA: thioredoxin family protein [Terracidiphilus sp.]|nr:thioredoxin family protein [Terracidiphilus sp.]